ncbi:MAG: GNAT family N-acetyltransferase [Thermotogota bacterium]
MECRRLLCDDAELAREAIGRIKVGDPKRWPSVAHFRAFLEVPENVLVVATENGSPVGFALAYILDRVDGDRRMALLYEIEVVEGHRRRGAAWAMIELLKSVCRAGNVFKMWAQTSLSNEAAAALYRSTGARAQGGDGDIVFRYDFVEPHDCPADRQ